MECINMALLNGKTPEQIASETIAEAVKESKLAISGTFVIKLKALTRYQNRDVIQMRNEAWYLKEEERLMQDVLEKLIGDKHKAVTDYMTKKENDAKMQFFLMLRSKGISLEDAEKQSGINQVSAA
jgi:hypothetical protein